MIETLQLWVISIPLKWYSNLQKSCDWWYCRIIKWHSLTTFNIFYYSLTHCLKPPVPYHSWFNLNHHTICNCVRKNLMEKISHQNTRYRELFNILSKNHHVKVRTFWEGHKILRNLHLTFVFCKVRVF